MFSAGSRSQIGNSRPVMMWNPLSRIQAGGRIPPPHRRKFFPLRRRQYERVNSSTETISRAIGRIRRVRASILPSSCIKLAAVTCTAARCDCSLTSNRAPVPAASASASASGSGRVAVFAQDAVAARLGAGRGVRVDDAALGDAEAFGRQCLDPMS